MTYAYRTEVVTGFVVNRRLIAQVCDSLASQAFEHIFSVDIPSAGAVSLTAVCYPFAERGLRAMLMRVKPAVIIPPELAAFAPDIIPASAVGAEVVHLVKIFPELDAFSLDGVRYYQRYTSCGKEACSVCYRAAPFGHGPYWHARDLSGQGKYFGEQLPEQIQMLRVQFVQAEAQMPMLQDSLTVLQRFREGKLLTVRDKAMLCDLGIEGFCGGE